MSEARQRWRLVFARGEEARYLSHLDAGKLWERAFRRGGIPVATTEGFNPRPRLAFAAPLPLGTLAEHELADLYLSERLTLADVRSRLQRDLPRGYRLLDLHDVWIGAASLASQLTAADYRLTVLGAGWADLAAAADRLLATASLNREKQRESKSIAYDLRPLLIRLEARPGGEEPAGLEALPDEDPERRSAGLWLRLRHSQDLGSGRADEVVAALADDLHLSLEIVRPIRERLWLADEVEEAG